MNRLWIRATAASLAMAATLSVLSGIDMLARNQSPSATSAIAIRSAESGARVASLAASCRAERRDARAESARCL